MAYEREYVERHLGEPLTLALTDICLKRPRDPILYLSQWLLHWQRNKDQMLVRRRELEELLQERQKLFELMVTETEGELEAEENRTVDENAVVEDIEDGLQPNGSIDEQIEEIKKISLENEMIKAHIPTEMPEPIIDKKLHPVSSPIFEVDEDNVEDKLVERASRKESSLGRDRHTLTNEMPTIDKKRTESRTSNRRSTIRPSSITDRLQ